MTSEQPEDFLGYCKAIDHDNVSVAALATSLVGDSDNETILNCFLFVRDEIAHSSDAKLNPVTFSASSVLKHRTGYCYAKSHLLAALLRANGIPTALCYQRVTVKGDAGPYCLHGLNAVFLSGQGWLRIDARGNRDDIDAQFLPPNELLAFPLAHAGESDLDGLYCSPLPSVVDLLRNCSTWIEVRDRLPETDPGGQQAR